MYAINYLEITFNRYSSYFFKNILSIDCCCCFFTFIFWFTTFFIIYHIFSFSSCRWTAVCGRVGVRKKLPPVISTPLPQWHFSENGRKLYPHDNDVARVCQRQLNSKLRGEAQIQIEVRWCVCVCAIRPLIHNTRLLRKIHAVRTRNDLPRCKSGFLEPLYSFPPGKEISRSTAGNYSRYTSEKTIISPQLCYASFCTRTF